MRKKDIDSTYNAIRLRLSSLGGSGGTSSSLPAHTHSASQIVMEPAGNLAADDVQEGLEELDTEKLARDGSQTMLGALDMNHYSISNADDIDVEGNAVIAENITFTGGVGVAKINPRDINLQGTRANNEGKIDGANQVIFNADPTAASIEDASRLDMNPDVEPGVDYVAAEGVMSWSNVDGVFGYFVKSGASVVFLAMGWSTLTAFASAP